jgi:hypothetical protein
VVIESPERLGQGLPDDGPSGAFLSDDGPVPW